MWPHHQSQASLTFLTTGAMPSLCWTFSHGQIDLFKESVKAIITEDACDLSLCELHSIYSPPGIRDGIVAQSDHGSNVIETTDLFCLFCIISFDGAISLDSVFQILSLINIQAHSILSQPVILSLCWMLEHKVGVDTSFTMKSIQVTVSQLMSVHSMNSRHNKAESWWTSTVMFKSWSPTVMMLMVLVIGTLNNTCEIAIQKLDSAYITFWNSVVPTSSPDKVVRYLIPCLLQVEECYMYSLLPLAKPFHQQEHGMVHINGTVSWKARIIFFKNNDWVLQYQWSSTDCIKIKDSAF